MVKKVALMSFISAASLCAFTSCKEQNKKVEFQNIVGVAADYSKGENWMVKQNNGDADVDVFYLYPTSVAATVTTIVAEVDQYMRSAAYLAFERGPACFDSYANIYAPYYRQLSAVGILTTTNFAELSNADYNSVVRTDVYAALDYYFDNYNNGKPFILASHSQGTAVMQFVLSEYMGAHPEYLSKMVAAYTLGGSYTLAYKEANPHLKFVTGELDTGVIIAWNTEGVNATSNNFVLCDDNICLINPLNWKTDSTYAGLEENKGSWDYVNHKLIDGVADAQIDTTRKCIVTTTAEEKGCVYAPPILFGDKSYHFDDWNFFYKNIQENALKRIAQFMNKD